jgi:hypothetical protein
MHRDRILCRQSDLPSRREQSLLERWELGRRIEMVIGSRNMTGRCDWFFLFLS